MAKSSDRVIYRKRAWLNKSGFHSTAFIFAEIVRWKGYNGGPNHSYTLKIGDCDRQITLDFGDGENDLHKLDALINGLEGFRNNLAACQDYYAEWKAANPPKKDDDG